MRRHSSGYAAEVTGAIGQVRADRPGSVHNRPRRRDERNGEATHSAESARPIAFRSGRAVARPSKSYVACGAPAHVAGA